MSILTYIEKIKRENEGPRITAQEPRIKVAELPDAFNPDLEQTEVLRPGETLETWEPNPFLKPHADGGRIGLSDGQLVRNTADGSRPGYRGEAVKRNKFVKFLDDQIAQGNTTFETQGDLIKAATGKDKAGGSESRVMKEYKDKFTFKRKTRLGGDEALKNEKILEFFSNQEPGSKINVERAVKDINKNLPKTDQISETIIYNRLKDSKFNTTFLGSHTVGSLHGQLSDGMKQNIIDTFGDDLDITMEDFAKKGKYGVNATTDINKYEAIRRFVTGGKWDVAYNVGAADGWLLESFNRAGYKPLKEVIRGVEKTIGYEAPDGTKWYGAKKWATKHNGKQVKELHPGWKRVDDLVNIVKSTRVAPSKAIMDLLSEGTGIKNIKGITLESLTGYLLNNDVDVTDIKKGLRNLPKHHVKGAKISPAADIQLVTRVANEEARRVVDEVAALKKKNLPIDYDAINKRLKNYGVAVEIDGKRLGGSGFESKADIEKWATKKIKELEKPQFEKLRGQLEKVFKDRKIPIRPGQAGFITTDILKDVAKLGPKGLRLLASDWVCPEIVIGWLDKQNMIQKGMSPERASSEMWKHVTFGLRDKGETENEILGQAKKLGYGEKDIKALENLMRFNKIGKKIKDTEIGIESMEKGYTPFSTEKGAQQLREKLENLKKEQESVAGFYFGAIGDKDANYGTEIYNQASKELMRTEWNKSLEGRKKRIDPYAGGVGDVFQADLFSLEALKPKHWSGLEKSPSTLAREKIAAMSPQELDKWNLQERGIGYERVHPMYGAAMSGKQLEPLSEQMDYMYAGGGRAGYTDGGLTRTVAPDSGPMSQGLRSLYINDKDY